MKTLKNFLSRTEMPLIITAILAVALQIQISLFATENYIGLCISLADFLLPFALLWAGHTLLMKKSLWPQWSMPKTLWWLAGLFIIMTIALLNGWLHNGFLSKWALINKYIGFIILIGYLLIGGWIATNARDNFLPVFLRVFVVFYMAILIASFSSMVIQPFIPFRLWIGNYFWDGLMSNRNAFAFLSIFVMITIETARNDRKITLPGWVYPVFWMLLPTLGFYNASRAGWIAGILIIAGLLFTHPGMFLKKIAPFLILGSLAIFFIYHTVSMGEIKQNRQFKYLVALLPDNGEIIETVLEGKTETKKMYGGDKKRLIAAEDGLKLYSQSNPIVGAGLGTYKEFQIRERGSFIDIIDFTALWLLVETGILGLLTFASFFFVVLCRMFKTWRLENSNFHGAVFFFLLCFAGMSLLHELMYVRFIWFLIGLALVLPLESTEGGSYTASRSANLLANRHET